MSVTAIAVAKRSEQAPQKPLKVEEYFRSLRKQYFDGEPFDLFESSEIVSIFDNIEQQVEFTQLLRSVNERSFQLFILSLLNKFVEELAKEHRVIAGNQRIAEGVAMGAAAGALGSAVTVGAAFVTGAKVAVDVVVSGGIFTAVGIMAYLLSRDYDEKADKVAADKERMQHVVGKCEDIVAEMFNQTLSARS